MKKIFLLLACLFFAHFVPVSAQKISPPSITFTDNGKKIPLRMNVLKVDVKILGPVATTIMEMSFINETNRVLEGELEFPLGEGQTVTRFAMSMGEKNIFREGVVVEKTEGRKIFEEVIRQKIDPALLEQTKGNNFRSRVYPLLPDKEKKILIAYEQELGYDKNSARYILPLGFKEKLDSFSLNIDCFQQEFSPKLSENFSTVKFTQFKQNFLARFSVENFLANSPLEITVPVDPAMPKAFVEERDGKNYFAINYRPELQAQEKKFPRKIALLWDASGSAKEKNIDREIKLLDKYFQRIKNVAVEFTAFRNEPDPKENFVVSDGDWTLLKKKMLSLEYDGATQLGALNLKNISADEIILSTDGISNFGKKEILFGGVPMLVLNSQSSADHSYLNYCALASGGRYINLVSMTDEQAEKALRENSYSFISASYGSNISETFPSVSTPVNGNFSFAGIMNGERAELTLNFGFGSTITHRQKILLEKNSSLVEGKFVSRLWAQKKLADLDLQFEKNKNLITELGKNFSIVTRNTSLIVLDRIEDYVRYKIIPPEEDLRKEYFARIEKVNFVEKNSDSVHFAHVLDLFRKRAEWWEKNFDTANAKKRNFVNDTLYSYRDISARAGEDNALEPARSAPRENSEDDALQPARRSAEAIQNAPRENLQDIVIVNAGSTRDSEGNFQIRGSRPSETRMRVDGLSVGDQFSSDTVITGGLPSQFGNAGNSSWAKNSSIALKSWDPKAPYLDELKKILPGKQYEKYLSLKEEFGSAPGFYLDVANLFAERKENFLALRILSNIAEIQNENHEYLRILARRLLQLGYTDLAIATFEDVLKIREEEPQSYRDLALANVEAKNFQRAVDLLYTVAMKKWDDRFPEIELIALNEMNAAIANSTQNLDLSKIDPRLIKNMSVQARIVLNWDTDNCDMDLWVTDPFREKCMYNHPNTEIGGHISRDLTGGYGPEEFLLKKAPKGKYKIQVNYYGTRSQKLSGPTTVQMEIYTNYGTEKQQKKEITVRLSESKQIIDIGEIEFGDAALSEEK